MPRAKQDLRALLKFIGRQPLGRPADRHHDIEACIQEICERPTVSKVYVRRRDTCIELRRRDIRQFAIVYVYFPPDAVNPHGLVSIRAIRHRRIRNVFTGVRESDASYALVPGSLN
jgi:plasmid stabilization system protein ParE